VAVGRRADDRAAVSGPPPFAVTLGASGAIPFVALAVAAWVVEPPLALWIAGAAATYGAVILSFIAGAHWGFASLGPIGNEAAARRLLGFSVVPSLLGWAALLLPSPWPLPVLAAAFLAVLALDRSAASRGLAPPWWMRLRVPLSVTVACCLAATLVALLARFGL
jgi:putative flippase GtrA